MNANEVIANRACELLGGVRGSYDPVDPNDHVNRSQSTNDVYPTALALATAEVGRAALAGIARLESALAAKAEEYGEREHLARTCLQDAVPLTIAATHGGQAHALGRTAAALAAHSTSCWRCRSARRPSAPASARPPATASASSRCSRARADSR